MPLWDYLAHYSNALNFVVCLSAVILGLRLYFRYRPPVFAEHRAMHWAFWFLLVKWGALLAQYAVVIASPEKQRWLLGLNDFTSVCDMAFAWTLLQGDYSYPSKGSYPKRTMAALLFLCVFFWGWNIFLSTPHALGQTANLQVRAIWIAPSDAFAAFTTPLIGFAFLLRYRGIPSALLFLMTLAYSVCQRPITFALLTSQSVTAGIQTVPGYLLILAVGKIFIGGMVYGLLFAQTKEYSMSAMELADDARIAIRSAAKKVLWGVLIAIIIEFPLALFAAWMIERYFKH